MTPHTGAALATASLALLAVLTGCGDSGPAPEVGTIRTEPLPAPEPELPPVEPVTAADCPYLSTAEASSLGGLPVTGVRIDESIDPAACFFYGADGGVTLTTTLYTVDSAERATELVIESAPEETAEQITVEGGWVGGSSEVPGGALVVLARGEQILAVQAVGEEPGPAQQVAELIGPRLAS